MLLICFLLRFVITHQKIEYQETYEYDDKGNLTDYKNYFHDSLKYIFSLKYDDNGNNTEWNKYNSNGSFNMKSSLKYDDKRNLTELNSYSIFM